MIRSLAGAALVMVGCTAAGPAHQSEAAPAAPVLAGATWQITAIDGRAPESHAIDGIDRTPHFAFSSRSYGGHAGCNGLGGLYVQVGDRLYTMPGPQTAMGCMGAAGAQEAAANAVLGSSPTVTGGRTQVILSGGGHRLELARTGKAPRPDPPTAWQGPGVARQSYVVHQVNGAGGDSKRLWGRNPPRLRFGPGEVTMAVDCPKPAKGVFTQSGDKVHAALLTPPCRAPGTRDAALARILGADPRTVSGPNGELLIASRFGWAILWNERRDRPK